MADGATPRPLLPWEKAAPAANARPLLPWEKTAPPVADAARPPLPWEVATPPAATEDVPKPEDFPTLFPTGNEIEPPRSYDYSERSPPVLPKPQFGPPEPPSMLSQIVTEGGSALATGATQQGVTTAYGLANLLVPGTPGTTAARPEIEAYFGKSPEERLAYRVALSKDNSATAQMLQMIIGDIEDGAIRSMEELDAYNTLPPAPEILPMRQRPLFLAARELEEWQERNLGPASPDFESGAGGAYRAVMGGLGQIATQIATFLGVGATAGPAAATGVTLGSSLLSGLGETVQEIYSKPNVAAAEEFQRGDQGVQPGLSSPPMADILTGRGADMMAGMSSPGPLETEMQRRVDTILDERLKQGRNWGLAAGGIELAPLETLLNGIPGLANAGRFARVLMQAAIEGGQEMVSQFLQNTGTGRQVTAYLTESGALGGTVGAIAQAINEMFIPGKQRDLGMGRRTPAEIAQLGRRTLPSRGGRLDPDQFDLPMDLPEQLPPGGIQPNLPMELPEQQAPAPGQEQYELPLPSGEDAGLTPPEIEPPEPGQDDARGAPLPGGTQVLPTGTEDATPTVQSVPGPASSEVVPVTREAVEAANQAWQEAKATLPVNDPRRDAALANYVALTSRFFDDEARRAAEAPSADAGPPTPPVTENAPVTPPGPAEGYDTVRDILETGGVTDPSKVRELPESKDSAVRYRGEVFWGDTHADALARVLQKHPGAEQDIDANLDDTSVIDFGVINKDGSVAWGPGGRADPNAKQPPPTAPISEPPVPPPGAETGGEPVVSAPEAQPAAPRQHPPPVAEPPPAPVSPSKQAVVGKKPVEPGDLLSLVRSAGGVIPTGNLRAQNAPLDILNRDKGKTISEIRERMEAEGYFPPQDPDQPHQVQDHEAEQMIIDAIGGQKIYSQHAIAQRDVQDWNDWQARSDRYDEAAGDVDNAILGDEENDIPGFSGITPKERDEAINQVYSTDRDPADVLSDIVARRAEPEDRNVPSDDDEDGGVPFGDEDQAPVASRPGADGQDQLFMPGTDREETKGVKVKDTKALQKQLMAGGQAAITPRGERFSIRARPQGGVTLRRQRTNGTITESDHPTRESAANAAMKVMNDDAAKSRRDAKKQQGFGDTGLGGFEGTQTEAPVTQAKEPEPEPKAPEPATEPKPKGHPVATPEELQGQLMGGSMAAVTPKGTRYSIRKTPAGYALRRQTVGQLPKTTHFGTKTEAAAAAAKSMAREQRPALEPEPKAEPTPAPTPAPAAKAPDGEPKVTLSIVGRRGPTGAVTYKIAFDGKVPGDSPGYLTPVAARSELFKIAAKNPDNWILKPETPGSSDVAQEPEPKPAPAPAPIPKRTYAPSGVAGEVTNRDELKTALDAGRAARFWITDDDGKNGRFRTIEIQREGGGYIIVRTENGQEKQSQRFDNENEAVRRASDYANQLPAGPSQAAGQKSLIGRLMSDDEDTPAPPVQAMSSQEFAQQIQATGQVTAGGRTYSVEGSRPATAIVTENGEEIYREQAEDWSGAVGLLARHGGFAHKFKPGRGGGDPNILRNIENLDADEDGRLEERTDAPAGEQNLEAFLGDSVVRDEVYRGQHGQGDRLETRVGTLTFVDNRETANVYAVEPNNRNDTVANPRVITAHIRIENPIFNSDSDPFTDLSEVVAKLGQDVAVQMARAHAMHVEGTNNWLENLADEFDSVGAMMDAAPERVGELYLDTYHLLDDPVFIAAARAAGYDGSINLGFGESYQDLEYRVFDPGQVRVNTTQPAASRRKGFPPTRKRGPERLEEQAAPPVAAPADPMAKLREALAEIQGMLNAQTQTQPAPDADAEPEQADMATLWGGDEEHIAAQDAATRETATLNSRLPRGGSTKTFLEASTSTDMPMNERSAYADAGADPNATLAATPEVRIATLIDLFKNKFGFKDVNRQGTYGTGNALQVIDHLVDGYRAIRMMMHVLGLPETGGSINGFISLVIGRKTKRSSFLGAYDPDTQTIELVGRSNSFAHEWMHALDQWLMQTVDPLSDGFLSRWTRTQGIDPAVDLEGHFINVMNAIFFDDAHLATRVLDLQIKAAQVYNPKHVKAGQPTVAAKDAQRMLDDIAQGKSRLINERSDTYKKAKRFGKGNPYWTNPAEMLARAFEAYVADKTSRIDPDFKSNFIHKGEAAYHTAAATDPRLKETYPQDADKARIFAMLDNLLAEVALRTSLAGPTSAPPTVTELLDDNAFYAHGAREARDQEEKERQRTIVARLEARLRQTTSLTGLREIRAELVESVQARLGAPGLSLLSWQQWLAAGARVLFQTEAANAEVIVYRPQNKAAQLYMEALAKTQFEMSPGSGRHLEETFTEATEASIRKYAGLVGNVLAKHKMPLTVPHDPITPWGKAQRASRDRINTLMTTGVKPPGITDEEVDVAGALRRIYDEFWREANRVGMNVGYVEDTSYQPVIPDMGKVNVDEDGFVRQATKLYSLVFGRAVGLPGHAREAKVDEAITDLQQSTQNSDLLDPTIVALRSQLRTLDQKIANLEGAQAAATDPKVIAGIEAQLKTLAKDKQDRLKQLATAIQPRWAAMKAQQWHDAAVKGEYSSAQMDTLGPQTRHTKERVLPPEAQQIMKDFLVADPIDAMAIYMGAMSRKIEYARRLGVQSGGDQDFEWLITRPNSPLLEEMEARGLDRNDPADRVKAIMTLTDRATANRKEMLLHEAKKAGAVAEDLRALAEQIEVMTGKRRDGTGPFLRTLPNAMHTLGTLALLPRSMLTSLAEPLTVLARTGDVAVAWEVMKHYGKEVFNSKDTTVQDVRDLATGIGLIASEAQDAMIQTTLAATPLGAKSQRILASFFERIGMAGLTRVQKRATMVGYELWVKKLLRIAQGTDPGDAAVARANLADLGIPAESIQMLDDFIHAGTTRFMTDAELRTPMGQLWQVGARRFARSVIQSSDRGNKPRFATHPYGQLIYGLTSFAYNFTRNIMLRLTRQAERDYKLRRGAGESHRQAYLRSARDNLLFRGVFGFAGLFLGQFLVGWAREFLFNNEQFNRHMEEGDLLEWMLGISASRTGILGAWDTPFQAVRGITYQRDITALTGGPYTNILLAAVQSAVMVLSSKNSPNTNTSERGFLREAQRLFVTPAISLGISIAPGGPAASWLYAGLAMGGTSNSIQGLISTWLLGPPTPRGGGGGGVER